MKYVRPTLVFLAAAAVMVVVLTSTGTSTADSGLEQRMAALDKRVAALETQVATLKTSVRGAHPDPMMEQEATVAFQTINALIREGDVLAAKPRLAAFMKEYGGTRAGKQAQTLNKEMAVVGKATPADWAVDSWFQGEDDVDFDSKGPTVLVFWETWCPHCRREVPKLQKVYDQYRDRGLQVLGLSRLSRNTTEEAIKSFITENNLNFPMLKEGGALASHFGVGGIPAVAVVKDKVVVWRGHPARLSNAMLENWLE